MTNLPDAFKDSSNDDAYEASCMCYDWCQDGEHSRPEDAEQQRSLSAEPLRYYSARDLRRYVAVEERGQNEALLICSPFEFTLLQMQCESFRNMNHSYPTFDVATSTLSLEKSETLNIMKN